MNENELRPFIARRIDCESEFVFTDKINKRAFENELSI